MPFDPDAYLASKAKPQTGGFDPDAYLAAKGASEPTPESKPEVKAPWYEGKLPDIPGAIREGVTSMATGMLAKPISDVAGLAAMGKELVAPTRGGGDPEGFRNYVRNALTYEPRTEGGKNLMTGLGKVGEVVNGIGAPIMAGIRGNAAPDTPRGMAANAIGEGASQGAAMLGMKNVSAIGRAIGAAPEAALKVPGRIGQAIESHYGLPQAREGALSAGRELATGEAARLGGEAASHLATGEAAAAGHSAAAAEALSEAHNYEDLSRRLERDLTASSKEGVPSLPKQGETLRSAMEGAYTAAKTTRRDITKPLYKLAEKEGANTVIDVAPVLKGFEKTLADAEHVPGLSDTLGKMYSSVKEAKGYSGLRTTIEYLKDIGYSGELQGYDRLARRAAIDLATDLDIAVSKVVPAHMVAAAKYNELSEPLTTLTSRIGKTVTATEGGIKGDAWSKIANEDLPKRLFAKKESVEQVVHALAGGAKATPEALAKAQKQVDQMVENYLMSSARGPGIAAPRAGSAALEQLGKAPGTVEAVPGAAGRVRSQLEREASKEKTMKELAEGSKEARGRAAESTSAAKSARSQSETIAKPLQTAQERVNSLVKNADELIKGGNVDEALSKYTSAVKSGLANDQPKYQAALAWINRAETAEKKVARAKKLAKWIAHGAAYTVGAGAVYEAGRQL